MKNKILVVILLGIVVVLFLFINRNETEEIVEAEELNELEKNEVVKTKENDSKVKVDIKGAVSKPGVYEVSIDARVNDVIKLAGGLKKTANTNYINLSAKVFDEMVIWIYTSEEIKELKLEQSSVKYMISECNCPVVDNTACLNNDSNANEIDVNDKIININTATLEQLTTLEGIGESKAKNIIDYREKNGKFNSIEDIMNVSGIGESAYNKIKDYIKV